MPERELLRPYCTILTDYAVRFRYPGSSADKAMGRDAVRSCKFIRDSLREVLGLPAATEKSGKKKKAVRRIRE